MYAQPLLFCPFVRGFCAYLHSECVSVCTCLSVLESMRNGSYRLCDDEVACVQQKSCCFSQGVILTEMGLLGLLWLTIYLSFFRF